MFWTTESLFKAAKCASGILIVSLLVACNTKEGAMIGDMMNGLGIQAPRVKALENKNIPKPIWGNDCGSGVTAKLVPDAWGYSGGIKAHFTSACRAHDRCYENQKGQKYCDDQFLVGLKQACIKAFTKTLNIHLATCISTSGSYFHAVHTQGG